MLQSLDVKVISFPYDLITVAWNGEHYLQTLN